MNLKKHSSKRTDIHVCIPTPLKVLARSFIMKYKIRVFNMETNKEECTVDEVFESKELADEAIERLKTSFSQDYQYVMVPIND